MAMTRTFVRVRDCALATGQKEKTIYEQIRTGIFPFRFKCIFRTIVNAESGASALTQVW